MTNDPALSTARKMIANAERDLAHAETYLARAHAAAGRFVTGNGDARDLIRADANASRVIGFASTARATAIAAREAVRGLPYTGTNRTRDRLLKTGDRLSRAADRVRVWSAGERFARD